MKSRNFILVIKKMININILNRIKTKITNWKKNQQWKKIDNEKTINVNILNVKFANITNLKLFKYANMFLIKRLTIFFEKTSFTILIVMIYLFII